MDHCLKYICNYYILFACDNQYPTLLNARLRPGRVLFDFQGAHHRIQLGYVWEEGAGCLLIKVRDHVRQVNIVIAVEFWRLVAGDGTIRWKAGMVDR